MYIPCMQGKENFLITHWYPVCRNNTTCSSVRCIQNYNTHMIDLGRSSLHILVPSPTANNSHCMTSVSMATENGFEDCFPWLDSESTLVTGFAEPSPWRKGNIYLYNERSSADSLFRKGNVQVIHFPLLTASGFHIHRPVGYTNRE